MKVEYINPFVSSVVNVFRTMLDTELTRGQLYVKNGFQPRHDISGIIGLSGKAKGTIVLSLERETAKLITEALLATELHSTQITSDVIDAVGELANIIAGGAKAQLAEYEMSVSLPSVITGKGHCIEFPRGSKPICIPFGCEAGNIEIEVGLVEVNPTPPKPAADKSAATTPDDQSQSETKDASAAQSKAAAGAG
jgi:chemotaxis protein CheX